MWLDEGFALSREVGDKESIANGFYLGGMLALSEGDTAGAASRVEQALELFQEMKRQDGTAHSLYALAKVATVQQDYAHSQALYEQGVKVARESGDKLTIIPGLEGLASAVAAQGQVALSAPTKGERPSSPTTASPPPYPDGLTAREVEVLRVVAPGLTNGQVAERLVISPRT